MFTKLNYCSQSNGIILNSAIGIFMFILIWLLVIDDVIYLMPEINKGEIIRTYMLHQKYNIAKCNFNFPCL